MNNKISKGGMKKGLLKRAAVLAVAAGMMVSATTMTASASSVSGSVTVSNRVVSCSGSNNISASGAGATTYAGQSLPIHVYVYYEYIDEDSGIVHHTDAQNSNGSTNVSARCYKPSGSKITSYRCQSTHTVVGDSTWKRTTTFQKYV